MKIRSKAPGKLILLGEYAVLEGASALVAAVNRLARVTIRPSPDHSFTVEAPVIDIGSQRFTLDSRGKVRFLQRPIKKLKFFLSIFEYAVQELEKRNMLITPIRITLDTSEFFLRKGAAKLGLGSSAALTVALLAALFAYYGGNESSESQKMELFCTALDAHRAAQGNVGSGIDVAACVFGHILHYRLVPPPSLTVPAEIHTLEPLPDIHYLPIWTGKASSTTDLVNKFYEFKRRNGNGYKKLFRDLSALSQAGYEAFARKNSSDFLDVIRDYYRQMVAIGEYIDSPVVSKEHQTIANIVYDFGAVYKPSGAGGGDFGIAVVRTASEITQLASIIQKAGFEVVHMHLGAEGIQVISS